MKSPNFLLLDSYRGNFPMPQTQLKKSLVACGRIRDYYNVDITQIQCKGMDTRYAFGNLVAQSINATAIGEGHSMFLKGGPLGINWVKSSFPRIFDYVRIMGNYNGTVMLAWDKYVNNQFTKSEAGNSDRKPMPDLILRETTNIKFVHCTIPEQSAHALWNFAIFADPLESWTWLWLFLVVILVSLFAFSSFRKGFSSAFLYTIAVLLNKEFGNVRKRKSKLLLLWIFCSIILVDLYTGQLTSELIQPPIKQVMTHFRQLEEKNMTLIYHHKPDHKGLIRVLDIVAERSNPSKDILFLSNKLKRAIYFQDILTFLKRLVTNKQFVFISSSILANVIASNASREARIMKHDKKKCYVSKQAVPGGEIFVLILPPRSIQVGKGYRRLIASGIKSRWKMEREGMHYSDRVQDRIKVFKLGSLGDSMNRHESIRSLKIEGKMVTVFLLLTFFSLISFNSFTDNLLYM